jgi:hypothetical protein
MKLLRLLQSALAKERKVTLTAKYIVSKSEESEVEGCDTPQKGNDAAKKDLTIRVTPLELEDRISSNGTGELHATNTGFGPIGTGKFILLVYGS